MFFDDYYKRANQCNVNTYIHKNIVTPEMILNRVYKYVGNEEVEGSKILLTANIS